MEVAMVYFKIQQLNTLDVIWYGRDIWELFLTSLIITICSSTGEVYVGVSGPECRPKSGNKNRKQII
jgi:hypothetical protein